jgi:predicted membrane channel-forming protein YqfA (hemolysin III family)
MKYFGAVSDQTTYVLLIVATAITAFVSFNAISKDNYITTCQALVYVLCGWLSMCLITAAITCLFKHDFDVYLVSPAIASLLVSGIVVACNYRDIAWT